MCRGLSIMLLSPIGGPVRDSQSLWAMSCSFFFLLDVHPKNIPSRDSKQQATHATCHSNCIPSTGRSWQLQAIWKTEASHTLKGRRSNQNVCNKPAPNKPNPCCEAAKYQYDDTNYGNNENKINVMTIMYIVDDDDDNCYNYGVNDADNNNHP